MNAIQQIIEKHWSRWARKPTQGEIEIKAEKLLKMIERSWQEKGKRPTESDMKCHINVNKLQLHAIKQHLQISGLLDKKLRPKMGNEKINAIINEAMKCRINSRCTAYYSR